MNARCGWCGRYVRVDKPVLGSLHICLTDDEKRQIAYMRQQLYVQQDFMRAAAPEGHSG